MRNLIPTGIANIRKPFVVLDIDSIDMKKRSNKEQLKNIKVEGNEKGPNASINQIYRIEIELPDNSIYLPSLRCEVNDIFLKILNETLGYFEIDLKKIFQETENKIVNSEQALSKLLIKEKKSILNTNKFIFPYFNINIV